MKPIFITGIGTGIGKTVVAAIVTEALAADYWKPVQAGFDDGTDTATVKNLISNKQSVIYNETYKLKLPASPHIAAKEENVTISVETIYNAFRQLSTDNRQLSTDNRQPTTDNCLLPTDNRQPSTVNYQPSTAHHQLIIEGAGGLLVPLNKNEFVLDIIKKLNASVLLISRNYLGSINHSLLTAAVCKANNIDVLGWIFNDQYLQYEDEIAAWSGYPKIASIPAAKTIDKAFIEQQAAAIKDKLLALL